MTVRPVTHSMTATTFTLDGHRFTKTLGVVRFARAVVGIQYDATEVMQGVTEVLCYGTAVVVVPI